MEQVKKEVKPVEYSAGAIKVLHFEKGDGQQCFEMHWHERFELLLIKSGTLEFCIGGKKGTAKAEEVVIIPPGTAHYGCAGEWVSYDVLMFDIRSFYNDTAICKSIFEPVFEGYSESEYLTDSKGIVTVMDRLCNRESGDSLMTVAGVYELMHLMIDSGVLRISKNTKKDEMRRIIEYIETEFAGELSTAQLCARFGYTPPHFCRKFKKATGLTPVTYLKIYRLRKAMELIKSGGLRINEIAEQCGFTDSNYFTRCFTKHYKRPPKHFINQQ